MRKKLLGGLIGFATGLYIASFLSTNVSSEIHSPTPLHKLGLIFVNSIIMSSFCFFGIYCMSDIDGSMEWK